MRRHGNGHLRGCPCGDIEHEGGDAVLIGNLEASGVLVGERRDVAVADRSRESFDAQVEGVEFHGGSGQSHRGGSVGVGHDVDPAAIRGQFGPVIDGHERRNLEIERLPEGLQRDIGTAVTQVGIETRQVLESDVFDGTGRGKHMLERELTGEAALQELRQSE